MVALAPGASLPAGLIECVCCGKRVVHPMVQAWDCDLEGYVCVGCVGPLATAEFELVQANRERLGIRRPQQDELAGLSEEAG